MDAKQLAEIKARADAATPAPWEYTDNGFDGYISSKDSTFFIGGEPCEGRIEQDADTEFIINARTDIPALVAEVERLKDDCDTLIKQRDEARQDCTVDERLNMELTDENATLKKALELAVKSKESAIQSNKELCDYYIQQAQEQEESNNA